MNSEYYVYALCDPTKVGKFKYEGCRFECEPFYIGKGKGRRADIHARAVNLGKSLKNKYKENKIRKILRAGETPLVLMAERRSEAHAFKTEKKLIKAIGRKHEGGPLTNMTAGGEGFTAPVRAAEAKRLRNWTKAMNQRTPEQRLETSQKIRISLANRSEVQKRDSSKKLSESLKGLKKSEAWHESQRKTRSTEEYREGASKRAKETYKKQKKRGVVFTRKDPLSAEARERIAEKARQRWADPDFRAKMQSHMSDMRKKAVRSVTGTKQTAEHRKKTSEARKRYWKEIHESR